ncbi:unnamed protein product, partial [Polarella glacialis]
EFLRKVEKANKATERVSEDSKAYADQTADGVDKKLSAGLTDLQDQLREWQDFFAEQLAETDAALKKALADELTALCGRLDQEMAADRSDVADALVQAAEVMQTGLNTLQDALTASLDELTRECNARAQATDASLAEVRQALREREKETLRHEERTQRDSVEIWLKLDRLAELVSEGAEKALEDTKSASREAAEKLSETRGFHDNRLGHLDELTTKLRAGLSEVQNVSTRRIQWIIKNASKRVRQPLEHHMKVQKHVSWFSPTFDAAGCHGLQLELQVYRAIDPPVEGQDVGDCAVFLWACRGTQLVYRLAVGGKAQTLEKRFNGRVPYGTARLCFFVDQINREDDTLVISAELLEAIRDLEAPIEKALPMPRPARDAHEALIESDDENAGPVDGPQPLEGHLLFQQHINNRLFDQVKDQVDSMKCRMVRSVEWRIEQASILRRCFGAGEAMCSTSFDAAGIQGLQLVFYPSGYTDSRDLGAAEGCCSLFLYAPAGAFLKCTLHAGKERRDATHSFDHPGAFGRMNFCRLESCTDESTDSILIRLEVDEAHQDVVAKAAHQPPQPGDRRSLSEQAGAVTGPIGSAVTWLQFVFLFNLILFVFPISCCYFVDSYFYFEP